MQLWRLTSPKICSRQTGDQENQWYSSSPKISSLETQDELMFQFKSKGRKNTVVPPQGSQAKEVSSYLQEVSLYFLFSSLLIGWDPPTLERAIYFTQMPFSMSTYYSTSSVSFEDSLQVYTHSFLKYLFQSRT